MTDAEVSGPRAPSPARARGTAGVGIASLVAAAAGYVVLVVTAHTLSEADNADFLTFWSLLFFLFGTLGGLQAEVTRAVHVTLDAGGQQRGARVPMLGLAAGVAVGALVAVTAPLWWRSVLAPAPVLLTLVVVVGVVAFAGHSSVAGSLAGAGRWTAFAGLVSAEASVRLALVGAAALLGADVVGLAAATAAAAGTWILLTAAPVVREALQRRTGAPFALTARPTALAMLGAASNSALVVGFTVLLRLTTDDATFATAAPLILAIQLTRAPLLVPLGAYQGMAITYVLRHRSDGLAPLLRIAGGVLATGVVAAGLAAAVGPWVIATFLPDSYRVGGLLLFELTLAAALLALLTLTGAASLAVGRHVAFSAGWVAATAAAASCLLLPLAIEPRAVLGLAVGPLVGIGVHAWAVHRAFRAGASA